MNGSDSSAGFCCEQRSSSIRASARTGFARRMFSHLSTPQLAHQLRLHLLLSVDCGSVLGCACRRREFNQGDQTLVLCW